MIVNHLRLESVVLFPHPQLLHTDLVPCHLRWNDIWYFKLVTSFHHLNPWTRSRFNVVTYRLHTFRCLGYPMLPYLHVLGQVDIVFRTHVVWSGEAEQQASSVPLWCLVITQIIITISRRAKMHMLLFKTFLHPCYLLFTSQNGDSGSSGLLDVIRWIATRGPGESGELYFSPLKKMFCKRNFSFVS